MTTTATYSPEDDKIRLYASARLDQETYARVKAAGYGWAPKQECFYAVWSPSREDIALELAGEIDDEDKTLVERAEERAERFDGYRENRLEDAHQAKATVDRIADGIPFGQPILVGHHSERHARKDAERIQNGMRRAVKMWETAEYWKYRAAGAIRAAKYKERPDVRARRIKGIESEIRVMISHYTPQQPVSRIMQQRWNQSGDAPAIPHVWVGPKGRGGRWVAEEDLPKIEAGSRRWLAHLRNRLEYERAMLAEGGGLAADQFDIQVGGRVQRKGEWFVVTGLNRKEGRLLSVSVSGHWAGTIPVEEIFGYREPEAGDAEKVKAAKKLLPLVNFRAPGCVEMSTAEWKSCCKCSDSYWVGEFTTEGVYVSRWDRDGKTPAYRLRTASARGSIGTRVPVFLTDAKVVEPPKTAPVKPERLPVANPEPDAAVIQQRAEQLKASNDRRDAEKQEAEPFEALRQSLKDGVQVVAAPQLFPTPAELAARMVEEANIGPEDRILEPSAGTGNLIRALHKHDWNNTTDCTGEVVAVEISSGMVEALRRTFPYLSLHQGDFLEQNGNLGKFDRVIMNPPFANGADVDHVRHAYGFLKPGGRLVAIMCEGPFFREDRKSREFRAWLDDVGGWSEQLPAGTFETSGTGVSTRLVVIDA